MTFIDLSAESAVAGGSTNLRGYLAEPAGTGPFPAVVMIHEAFGLDDELPGATRTGWPGRLPDPGRGPFQRRRHGAAWWQPCRSLLSAATARRSRTSPWRGLAGRASDSTNGKTGVIGFCMGGGFALLVAQDGFDAAAVNYGRLPGHPEEALRGACPSWPTTAEGQHPARRRRANSKPRWNHWASSTTSRNFQNAGHAFMNDAEDGPRPLRPLFRVMGIGPDPEAAPEAWQRIEDHFARHLKRLGT